MIEGRTSQRRIILAALFIAASVALGHLLAGIPNVELMTLSVFLGGALCGMRLGAAIGALAMLIHSLLNPLGPAPAPLLAAQAAGYALTGFAGGFLNRRGWPAGARGVLRAAAAGFVLTAAYDVITTLATALVTLGISGFAQGIGGVFVLGIAFAAIHVGVNTALFAAAVAPVLAAARASHPTEAA